VTTVARRFASTPLRTATETWSAIVDILCPDAGEGRDELEGAAGVIAMLIADEATRARPIIVTGTGPQVRIYSVHGPDAVDGTNVNEGGLAQNPTTGTWTLVLPVPDEDVEWVTAKLAEWPHIVVAGPSEESNAASEVPVVNMPVIDLTELRRA
jgi:hypothetical protein